MLLLNVSLRVDVSNFEGILAARSFQLDCYRLALALLESPVLARIVTDFKPAAGSNNAWQATTITTFLS